jgi:hypothetical protein
MKILSLIPFFFLLSGAGADNPPSASPEEQFVEMVTQFNGGLATKEAFGGLLVQLRALKEQLQDEVPSSAGASSAEVALLQRVEAVHDFVGEIGPEPFDYELSREKLDLAKEVLQVQESWYAREGFCLPVMKISLWNGQYVAYLLFNESGCPYTYHYSLTRDSGQLRGNGSIGKKSLRQFYQQFGDQAFKLNSLRCDRTKGCR